MKKIFPPKLKSGDGVRVIAPADSMGQSRLSKKIIDTCKNRLNNMGLKVSFGKNVYELNDFNSSSIKSRVEDLHDAFSDKSIGFVISFLGGFNSNQLLKYIDYELIRNNPKIICGYSDITALLNAIFSKTGLITYHGPSFFTFGEDKLSDFTVSFFKKCLMDNKIINVYCSEKRSDDRWGLDQINRNYYKNECMRIINEGETEGTIVGGNQCTLNLLQGTEFFPDIKDSILFLEDDYEVNANTFDRDLQSIIHQKGFDKVKGIVIGRFEQRSGINKDLLTKIIKSKKELDNIPVIGNIDFGHTTPMITFPIGGTARISALDNEINIQIVKH